MKNLLSRWDRRCPYAPQKRLNLPIKIYLIVTYDATPVLEEIIPPGFRALKHQISGSKLPSNGQVLAVLFHNIREVNLTVDKVANFAIHECIIFWEKAVKPTKSLPNCLRKLVTVYQVWRDLQKNAKKLQDVFKRRQQEFISNLDNLFDIAHSDALQLMKTEEDRMFLQSQREPGLPGHLGGVDKKLTGKEERRDFELSKKKIGESNMFPLQHPRHHTNHCKKIPLRILVNI
ncbi:hypothetical protein AVEN_2197-1 [Araneus ventricosus]|uniref:Uncharacterized protein n=1 Tax=Araneus ventricosus TaxID=182803 RepID=A0A4Y2UZ35_ARAVE|nr:hypothetical protein AVEN_2197-1 [Araneus ventricosus]